MSLSRSDPTNHWGNNSYTAAFLPKVAYLELQDQTKPSLIMLYRTDISMSWRCLTLQGNTWAASFPRLPACSFIHSMFQPSSPAVSACATFMLQLIKHTHYLNWQAPGHYCCPTYFHSALRFLAVMHEEHETPTARVMYCSSSNIHSCKILASNTERASASYKSIHETQKLKQM